MKLGAKIELDFLVQGDNGPILKAIAVVLHAHGWTYNHDVPGEYTIWLDGPITKFGESRTVREHEISPEPVDIRSITPFLRAGYSPSVSVGKVWFDKPLRAVLSVTEGDLAWRRVAFSLDRYESIDRFHDVERERAKTAVMELFRGVSLGVAAYCAVCGTEMFGLPLDPLDLDQYVLSGEIIYFSAEMLREREIEIDEVVYDCQLQSSGGVLVWRRKGLLEIGTVDLVNGSTGIGLRRQANGLDP